MTLMKAAARLDQQGSSRLAPLKTGNPVDILYGCLKDLPRNPLAELEAEHRAEIEADKRWQRRGR